MLNFMIHVPGQNHNPCLLHCPSVVTLVAQTGSGSEQARLQASWASVSFMHSCDSDPGHKPLDSGGRHAFQVAWAGIFLRGGHGAERKQRASGEATRWAEPRRERRERARARELERVRERREKEGGEEGKRCKRSKGDRGSGSGNGEGADVMTRRGWAPTVIFGLGLLKLYKIT
jgi:hypothetical protein